MANPFVHVELNTPDVNKAKQFYGKLFDWQLEDMSMGPAGTYTMIKVGEGRGGGMMAPPPGGPTMWLAYVQVDDIEASTQKAKSLGAKVMRDVTDIPRTGRFSILTDPAGAMFAMFQAVRKP